MALVSSFLTNIGDSLSWNFFFFRIFHDLETNEVLALIEILSHVRLSRDLILGFGFLKVRVILVVALFFLINTVT